MPRPVALIVLMVASLLLVACSSTESASPSTQVDALQLRIDRLHRQMDTVAQVQSETAPQIGTVLQAIRELDAFVAGMRDPQRIRETEERWSRVDAAFEAAAPDGLREPLVQIALEVDAARATLARAREAVADEWERSYLDAEDDVLRAVRRYAEATDALVQVIQQHWPTYRRVHEQSAAYVEANELYRSPQEAVQAYEVRIGRLLGALGQAQEQVGSFRDAQAEAARAVNRASRRAAETWASRPPSPAVTG